MSEAPETSTISLKDALVIVPVLSSALAVSWEVGSFTPIGGNAFSLFTLTEHLAFASTALPVAALLVCFTCFMWIGAPLAIDSYFAIRKKPKPERAPPVLLRILGVVLGLYSIAVGIFFGFSAFIVLGSAVALLFAITFFVRIHLTRSPFAALGLVSFSILLAMLFGVDETRKQLNQKSNRARADLRLLDKSLKSIVLRSGERGILTYNPQSQIFSFNKWETVKGVDWSRRGLRATAEEAASELLR